MSKNEIQELNENNEEGIELKWIGQFNNMNNIVPAILLSNEIIVNIVIKNSKDNIILKKVIVSVEEGTKTQQVIGESVNLFNKLFEYERMFLRLSVNDLSLYSFKPSKKNGLPNYDYPSNLNILFCVI